MSNALIGFLLGAGFGTWVYSKMMRKTGNNLTQAATMAVIAGLVVFLITTSLLSFIPTNE